MLPYDVIHHIYAKARPNVQAAMRRSLPGIGLPEDYARGTGRYQKLWNTLLRRLTTIARESTLGHRRSTTVTELTGLEHHLQVARSVLESMKIAYGESESSWKHFCAYAERTLDDARLPTLRTNFPSRLSSRNEYVGYVLQVFEHWYRVIRERLPRRHGPRNAAELSQFARRETTARKEYRRRRR